MSSTVHVFKVSRMILKNYNYLVVDDNSNHSVLVDPAWELNTLEHALEQHQADLKAILVTHSHEDHVNLCGKLAKRRQVPVFMSRTEIDFYNFRCDGLTPLESEAPFSCGTLRIVPYFTPGHTRGGVCYQIDNNLFTGDTLFTEGCGICVGKGSDAYAMYASLQRLKKDIPENIRIYPGHSFGQSCGQTMAYLIKNNLYLQFETAEQFVAFRTRKGQSWAKWFSFQ